MSTDGGMIIQVDIKVSVGELATWPPEQIKAFMHGVSLILSAQQFARSAYSQTKEGA